MDARHLGLDDEAVLAVEELEPEPLSRIEGDRGPEVEPRSREIDRVAGVRLRVGAQPPATEPAAADTDPIVNAGTRLTVLPWPAQDDASRRDG